jgi:hypothetical protein
MDVDEGKMKKNVKGFARFGVLTVMNIDMIVGWDMALLFPTLRGNLLFSPFGCSICVHQ